MSLPLENLPISQQPDWPDKNELSIVLAELGSREPLTTPQTTNKLAKELSAVARGKAFLLQGGHCAESFSDTPESVQDLVNVILPMTVTLMWAGVPVTKVGRVAGQFAKPRSASLETKDGLSLPSYRGDIVNGVEFTESARKPDPWRMLQAYEHAQASLHALNRLTTGGYADLEQIHNWNVAFADSSSQVDRYKGISDDVRRYIRFMKASQIRVELLSELHEARMYTSHEALLLDYEAALTRQHTNGLHYASSANMLWIGERTRNVNEAHVAYCSRIANPIGVKIGPSATTDEVIGLCERLNPLNTPGRLSLISRMGAHAIQDVLPPLINAVRQAGHSVIWVCDPMHGNTITTPSGQKTRHFDTVSKEVSDFLSITKEENVWPGGLHLEMTGENVTECLGGSQPNEVVDLEKNYTTNCDPRLNPTQSLELAFIVAEQLEKV